MHNRKRIGPQYSSSFDNTFPFCNTSILSSFTNVLAATLVGSIKVLQSTPEGSSPRFDRARGISLGQHVLPGALLLSNCRISCFSICSVISSNAAVAIGFDAVLLFVLDDCFVAFVFSFLFLVPSPPLLFTKCSFIIFLPSNSNLIPSASSIRFFFLTFGWSSPQLWQNPPIVRSDATTGEETQKQESWGIVSFITNMCVKSTTYRDVMAHPLRRKGFYPLQSQPHVLKCWALLGKIARWCVEEKNKCEYIGCEHTSAN